MKRMLPWLITILLSITLIAVVAFMMLNNILGDSPKDDVKIERISADKRVQITSEIKDITTNLSDPDYVVKIDFAFQLDKKKTKEDFEKVKDIAIKPIIISTLSDVEPDSINGSKGKDALKSKLLNLINRKLQEMMDGKLVTVDITNIIVTQM